MKSNKLRNSARGQECQVKVLDVCNYNPETTILAHLNFNGGKMGGKEHDMSAAYACSECHDFIDRRKYADHPEQLYRDRYMARALANTHILMFDNGVLK